MKRKLLFFAIFGFVFFVGCSAQEDFNNFTSKPVNSTSPDTIAKPGNTDNTDNPVDSDITPEIVSKNIVVAHRGAWKTKNLPQNSIASLREAVRLECKGSEFDIVLTADDSLVVCHDEKYNNLAIQKSKYLDLITLKLSNGENLPTLREYILAGKENNTTTKLFCEFKNFGLSSERKKTFAYKVLALVKSLKAEQFMVYMSFDYPMINQIRALNSKVNTLYLNGELSPEQLMANKISGLCYSYDIIKRNLDWIENAKNLNISLNVWVVNYKENIKLFSDYKFDSIITDEPEYAFKILGAN
ncbi:glycerophosphodiester phosphodiesterase family protein [Flavobacterium sp. ASV13]|uniref:glycerophosphodiester phosphodiesterase n=1 Tax=Flavobacterium sp. ASV13 TaxID=1506583 RepID=UPI000690843D|nr:glycerophosphodiester phosphodiesterase family protein [Flavobacterium sp. ASV13]